jgi:hypothetical protein
MMRFIRAGRPALPRLVAALLVVACLACAALPAWVWASRLVPHAAYPNAIADVRCTGPTNAVWRNDNGVFWSRSTHACYLTQDSPLDVHAWYREAGWATRPAGGGTGDRTSLALGGFRLEIVRDQSTVVRGARTRIFIHHYLHVGFSY